jgi:hypothetical protein
MPNFLAFDRSPVAERFAKNLGQKIALHLRFFELLYPAGGFEVGPSDKHGLRGLNGFLVVPFFQSGLFEKPGENKPVGLWLASRYRKFVEKGFVDHFNEPNLPQRHSW